MKNQQATCFVSTGLCVAIALLRMFAPELPFDWMTLALILAAAAFPIILCSAKPSAKNDDATPDGDAPAVIPEMDALHLKMAEGNWKRGEGELPEALSALHEENPFAAMCAARGILAMLRKSAPKETEDEAVTLLIAALDAAIAAGEMRVERVVVDALFTYSLQLMEI